MLIWPCWNTFLINTLNLPSCKIILILSLISVGTKKNWSLLLNRASLREWSQFFKIIFFFPPTGHAFNFLFFFSYYSSPLDSWNLCMWYLYVVNSNNSVIPATDAWSLLHAHTKCLWCSQEQYLVFSDAKEKWWDTVLPASHPLCALFTRFHSTSSASRYFLSLLLKCETQHLSQLRGSNIQLPFPICNFFFPQISI